MAGECEALDRGLRVARGEFVEDSGERSDIEAGTALAESPEVQAALRSRMRGEAEAGFAMGLPTGGGTASERAGAPSIFQRQPESGLA